MDLQELLPQLKSIKLRLLSQRHSEMSDDFGYHLQSERVPPQPWPWCNLDIEGEKRFSPEFSFMTLPTLLVVIRTTQKTLSEFFSERVLAKQTFPGRKQVFSVFPLRRNQRVQLKANVRNRSLHCSAEMLWFIIKPFIVMVKYIVFALQ